MYDVNLLFIIQKFEISIYLFEKIMLRLIIKMDTIIKLCMLKLMMRHHEMNSKKICKST